MSSAQNVTVYDEFFQPIYKYALRLCHDETLARYVTADAFAGLFEHEVVSARSYLYRSAYHGIKKFHRENLHFVLCENCLNLSDGNDLRPVELLAENRFLEEENHSVIQKIASLMQDLLTSNEQRCVILRFIQNRSLGEVAISLETSIGNIKVIQLRAIQKLRKKMGVEVKSSSAHGGICFYPCCSKKRTRGSYCDKHYHITVNLRWREDYRKKNGWS